MLITHSPLTALPLLYLQNIINTNNNRLNKTSIRTACNPAEIRTEHLHTTNLELQLFKIVGTNCKYTFLTGSKQTGNKSSPSRYDPIGSFRPY